MSTPESLYRNAIDLNRYSNSVARRVINAYNDIILDSVNQLRAIDDLDESLKAARLRSIIAQLKESLATWAGDSTELTALELQGLAELPVAQRSAWILKHETQLSVAEIAELTETTAEGVKVRKIMVGEAIDIAKGLWSRINLLNLRENILPTRQRAQLILRKKADHTVESVALRKL